MSNSKINLDKYKNKKPVIYINSSISVRKDQKEWIDTTDFNFSAAVRDFIDELMSQDKTAKKKK